MGKIAQVKKKMLQQTKLYRNKQRAASVQLPPKIADLGSKKIREFGWKEMKYSNCRIVPSLLAKN